ncbi:microtubule associated protein-domain-containing protein [Apiospora phragmitis]|uniref:Microtubule associated protein-domain-containing protein n=1 Tax=Apiospora phragmitis TaxID=2905665 RepID=A0ABR1TRE8_9PEZI
MDPSYLSQQVNTIIGQLHGLFDEIGVPNHDRETREAELFAALSDTLNNQVKSVTAEKKKMLDDANQIITVIRQMEASLDESKSQRHYSEEDDELRITFPLSRCLKVLKEKQVQVGRLHRERFEQVKTLESYSSHLEPTFVKIALPPTGPNQSLPPSFDLSPAYVDKLDDEFTRVYEEYARRVATVKALSENIIQLWAELGTPQAQTDAAIVKFYRDAPEQLGLHEEDLARLRGKRDKLSDEKKNRENRLRDLKTSVEALWDKLGIDESERKGFLNGNRGCGVRQINEFEAELSRLNELKRQNLHLFVEDARYKLQELWDALYYSEDEMLEFTPAFSDVYSDALLEAHEREIARLETLQEQRAPTLALVERHRTLTHDRDELAASSQDASRLMMRGQKGERRDPGKLLREEKMRKRIAKELPKVAAELRKALEQWEDEYGRDFLVHGERYLDILEADEHPPRPATAGGTRAKTPANPPQSAAKKAPPPSRTNSTASKAGGNLTRSKTPNALTSGTGSLRRVPPPIQDAHPSSSSVEHEGWQELPRETKAGISSSSTPSVCPVDACSSPKMRELVPGPPLATPNNPYKGLGLMTGSSSNIRAVEPEDVYLDREASQSQSSYSRSQMSQMTASNYSHTSAGQNERFTRSGYPQAPPLRQVSDTSTATTVSTMSTAVSGSENWETYDDNSEPEPDASDTYYAKVRAAQAHGKRFTPEDPYSRLQSSQTKRIRGIPPMHAGHGTVDAEGNRTISGSEWTDDDPY